LKICLIKYYYEICLPDIFQTNSYTNLYTVATEKYIYQEYMERTLFHSELWGIFPIKFFPEADNKISTSPEIVHVNFPINIGKISMEKSE
jgi:hypothetical protein